MSATIFFTEAQKIQILITLEHGQSMLNFEEKLQQNLNEAGQLARSQQLEYLDTDGSPMTVASVHMTSKSHKEPKVYETPWSR